MKLISLFACLFCSWSSADDSCQNRAGHAKSMIQMSAVYTAKHSQQVDILGDDSLGLVKVKTAGQNSINASDAPGGFDVKVQTGCQNFINSRAVPLNSTGFASIQSQCCAPVMAKFIERLVNQNGDEVCNAGALNGLTSSYACPGGNTYSSLIDDIGPNSQAQMGSCAWIKNSTMSACPEMGASCPNFPTPSGPSSPTASGASTPSAPSPGAPTPSGPSPPSAPSPDAPTPSGPSTPSAPSGPSTPSTPSAPSGPSTPSTPSAPSTPPSPSGAPTPASTPTTTTEPCDAITTTTTITTITPGTTTKTTTTQATTTTSSTTLLTTTTTTRTTTTTTSTTLQTTTTTTTQTTTTTTSTTVQTTTTTTTQTTTTTTSTTVQTTTTTTTRTTTTTTTTVTTTTATTTTTTIQWIAPCSAHSGDVTWDLIWHHDEGSNPISVWRPSKPGYCSLGDVMVKDDDYVIKAGTVASFIPDGPGRQPLSFQWKGAEDSYGGVNYWEPVCPAGHVALGDVAVQAPDPSQNQPPPVTSICCVPVASATAYTNSDGVTAQLWNHLGTGSGMDNTQWKRKGLETFVADFSNCAYRFSPPCTPYYAFHGQTNVCQPVATIQAAPCISSSSDVTWNLIWKYSGGPNPISVWRPSKPGHCSLGDVIVQQDVASIPANTAASFIPDGPGRQPSSFDWKGAENQAGGVNYWEPVCQQGHVAMGDVAVQASETSQNQPPPVTSICCVPVASATAYSNSDGVTAQLWSDPGTGGMDNTQWKRKGLETFVADVSNCAYRFSPPCTPYYAYHGTTNSC